MSMKVKMLTALSGLEYNYRAGDIVETSEGARWCEHGIAIPVKEERKLETATKPLATETASAKPKAPTAAKVIKTLKDSEV